MERRPSRPGSVLASEARPTEAQSGGTDHRGLDMDVRAAVAYKAGAPLQVETVRLDGPKAGEVLVEIKATGICHTDEFTLSGADPDRKSTRLNSSHVKISYAVFCLKKKRQKQTRC